MKFIPIIFICIVIYFLYRYFKNKRNIEISHSRIIRNSPTIDEDVSYPVNSRKCTMVFKSRVWDWDENMQCP